MADLQLPRKLTYERLAKSLGRLQESVPTQFPDATDVQRAQDLQRAIRDALGNVRLGMSGVTTASPARLKQDLKLRIAEIHAQHDNLLSLDSNTALNASATSAADKTSRGSQPSKRSARSTSEKENRVPAPPSSQHVASRTLSAVKKTPLTKRNTNNSFKPSHTKPPSTTTPAGIKKRPTRTRTKSAATVAATPHQRTVADEAERRACAAALLGLADCSPETSFTSVGSTGSAANWSAEQVSGAKKRGRDVYEDEKENVDTDAAALAGEAQPRLREGKSPSLKRRRSSFVPLPSLEGFSVHAAFEKGVQFAVAQLSWSLGQDVTVGEDLNEWVRKELDLHASTPDRSFESQGNRLAGDAISLLHSGFGPGVAALGSGGTAKKGFWDVV